MGIAGAAPPANDDWNQAADLALGTGTVSTNNSEAGFFIICEPSSQQLGGAGKTLWFRALLPAGGEVILDGDGSPSRLLMAVFSGPTQCSLQQVPAQVIGRVTSFCAEPGVQYHIQVDTIGSAGDIAFDYSIAAAGRPPASFTATRGTYADRVELRWSEVPQASGYVLERAPAGTPRTQAAEIARPPAPAFTDTTAEAGLAYQYWVGAISGCAIADPPAATATGWLRCDLTVGPSPVVFGPAGGSQELQVTTGAYCTWDGQVEPAAAGWLEVEPASGTAGGLVTLRAASNATLETRRGNVYINNGAARIEVVQDANECAPILDERYLYAAPAGERFTIAVAIGQNCLWEVEGAPGWIQLPDGGTFVGPERISLEVFPSGEASRSAQLSIGGAPVEVFQAGTQTCAGFLPGEGSLAVPCEGGVLPVPGSAPANCPSGTIAFGSSTSWITRTIDPEVDLAIEVAPNGTGQGRTATVYVNGMPLEVEQAGCPANCTVAIAAQPSRFFSDGGRGFLTGEIANGCPLAASTQADWIVLGNGISAAGRFTMPFEVLPNTGATRWATILVGSGESQKQLEIQQYDGETSALLGRLLGLERPFPNVPDLNADGVIDAADVHLRGGTR